MNALGRLCVMGLLLAGMGCGTTRESSQQLERVAKDWCLAVRASQIMPVYPLTEDVQPGDVFLVQTAQEDQARVWRERGFLPLENLLVRLPVRYAKFYAGGYLIDDKVNPPRHWQFPAPPGTASDFASAPRAAFPTYDFSVSRSGGLSVAVPVQAVPIGLNLLNSASANGTITIKDSYTYGAPLHDLERAVVEWAASDPAFLRQWEPVEADPVRRRGRQQFYLRVVNRVYLTRQMTVSLFSNQATSGAATAGAWRGVDLLNIGTAGTDAATNFDKVNAIIDKALKDARPPTTAPGEGPRAAEGAGAPAPSVGGTVRVAMASSRSISLNETFDRPLVIGYISFDLPILPGGQLGAPVSTLAQLDGRRPQQGAPLKWEEDENGKILRRWLLANRPANYQRLVEWLRAQRIDADPADITSGAGYAELRARIVREFNLAPGR
jgi:hypothetical protein